MTTESVIPDFPDIPDLPTTPTQGSSVLNTDSYSQGVAAIKAAADSIKALLAEINRISDLITQAIEDGQQFLADAIQKVLDEIQVAVDDQIKEINDYITLQFESLSVVGDSIVQQVEDLEPYLELLKMPSANPGAIVSYLQKLATTLVGPQLTAATVLIAQSNQLAVVSAEMTEAVTELVSSIDGVIPVPVVTIPIPSFNFPS